MKSKIEEILYKHSERVGLYEGGVITCVDENEFDEITEEVVKLFTIPAVSNRRELLIAFCNHGGIQSLVPTKAETIEQLVDDFESNL